MRFVSAASWQRDRTTGVLLAIYLPTAIGRARCAMNALAADGSGTKGSLEQTRCARDHPIEGRTSVKETQETREAREPARRKAFLVPKLTRYGRLENITMWSSTENDLQGNWYGLGTYNEQ